jgi:hypothetical protein
MSTFGVNNVMVAFPLEFFNFITNNLKLTDIRGKIINTKDVKIKIIQTILNKKSIPKCQDKWNNVYNEEFHWPKIWNNLKRLVSISLFSFFKNFK